VGWEKKAFKISLKKMENLSTLEHFSKLPNDPRFELRDIISNPNHYFFKEVMNDLEAINKDELAKFCDEHSIEFFIEKEENKDLARRTWFLEDKLRRNIAELRLSNLATSEGLERPTPYDSEELQDLEVDENGLTFLKNFDFSDYGLTFKNRVYQLCPSLPQFNSSYWLFDLLKRETQEHNLNFKIRVDPLVNLSKEEFRPMAFKMQMYGQELNWERIKNLKEEEHGQWLRDSFSTESINITDFVWSPSRNEVHFTCEELPQKDWINLRGSRYFHAIFDKSTGSVVHCDGAIRIYNKQELEFRQKYHVRRSEVRKIAKRVKLFRIDEPISQELFMNLATNFMVWNQDVLKYFNPNFDED
jgi:hypothetical protein